MWTEVPFPPRMFGFGGAFSSAAEAAPPTPKAEEPAATDAPAGGEAVEAVEAAAVVDEAIEPEVSAVCHYVEVKG